MEEELVYSQNYMSTQTGLIPQLIEAIHQSLQNYLPSNAVFLCERLISEQDNEDTRNLLAQCYMQENKLYKVHQLLKNSKDERNRYLFGVVCARLGFDKEAERALKTVSGSYAQVILGGVYEKGHHYNDAGQAYRRAVEMNPTLWVGFEKLVRLGEQEQPARIFQEKVKKKIGRKESEGKEKEKDNKGLTFLQYSQKLEDEGKQIKTQSKPQQQQQQYKKLGQVTQGSLMQLLRKFADSYYQMCFYLTPDAINSFQKLPSPHNTSNLALVNIARCFMELTKYQEAEHYFKMLRLEGVDYYSSCLWHLKKQVELCQLASRCLECSMYASETWIVVGNCFSLQKEHENALKFFNRAIQLNPNNAYAHSLCGLEYTYNEDFQKAQKCFEASLNLDIRLYNAWWGLVEINLGNVHFKQEKYDKAAQEFERAIQINSRCPVLYTYLGMTLSNKGEYRLALQQFENSELLEPNNALNKYQKANALVKLEQYDSALNELEKLKIMMPRESPIPILMGTIYKKLGKLFFNKIKEAHQQFTFALDLEPKDAQRIKALIESLHHANDFNEDMDYA